MKRRLLLTLVAIVLVSFVSAQLNDLGTFQKDTCVSIKQVCASCSYVNLTISYPNSSLATINSGMNDQGGGTWSFDFCNTTLLGEYAVTGEGDISGTATGFDSVFFEITYNGKELDTEKSILYLGLIAILILMFVLTIFSITKLPSNDITSEEGILLDINKLKYLRPVLWAFAWGLLIAIVFVTSNISLAYLPHSMFGEAFFMLYRIMFLLTLPMTIIWFLSLFAKIWRDREIKHMIERGIEIRSTP